MNSVSSKESAAFKPKRRANPSIAMATPKAEKQQVRSRSVSPAMSELDEEGEQVDVTSSPVLGDGLAGSGKRGRSNSREQDPEARPNNKDKTSVSKIRRSTSKLMNCSFSIRSIMQSDSTETPAGEPNPQPLAQQSTQEAIYSYLASQKQQQQQQQATNFLAGHSVPPLGEPMSGLYPNLSINHLPPQTQNESPTSGYSPLGSSSSVSSRQSSPGAFVKQQQQPQLNQHQHQQPGNLIESQMKQMKQQQQQLKPRSLPNSQPSASRSANGQATCSSDSRLSQVECTLDNKDMWDKFHSLNTEMIITKTGRRMFPVMKVQFHNLDPNARYAVSMDIVPVDNKRYRYAYHKSCWQMAGKADPSAEPRLYPHPDSPFNGDLLSRQVISFEKVKLTNNEMDKSGHIILNSMHKYQPRVHLIELKVPQTNATISVNSNNNHLNHHPHQSTSKSAYGNSNGHHHNQQQQQHQQPPQQPQLDIEGYRTFVFPETVFTAVTAYQNQLITKMKIDKNPFAKGFRDSSRLSDLDRNDPFDYMSSLGPGGPSGRFPGGPGGPMDSAAAAAAAMAAGGAHMDAYQQLLAASAANNPWYSAVAAATGAGANPFANPMAAAACSNASAQAAQLQATQMWLAAFSACLNGGGPPSASAVMMPGMVPPGTPGSGISLGGHPSASPMGASPHSHLPSDPSLGGGGGGSGGNPPTTSASTTGGPDSSGGSSSSSANCSGNSF